MCIRDRYKSMGRGSSFLKHEQKEAGSWVTPDMILGYERNRMQSIYQKHYDRIEALKAAETGTDEEKAQAAKEYAETAKRFDKIGSDISLQISLNDIIAAEELKQSVKMSIHDRRIEELISTDENLTDEPAACAAAAVPRPVAVHRAWEGGAPWVSGKSCLLYTSKISYG